MTTWESHGHVTDDVKSIYLIIYLTSIYLGPNVLKTAGNRDLDPIEHQYEMAHWDSNGHVTQKGQGHDPNIFGAHYLDNGWRYGLGANGAPIGNDYLGIKWSRDR